VCVIVGEEREIEREGCWLSMNKSNKTFKTNYFCFV
jgi:hypothetical protein